mgnify:CR=1 FL=1
MKINRNKLIKYLKEIKMSMSEFVKNLGWDYKRFIDMLFDNGVGAEDAMKIINWRQMNVRKPKYREIFQYDNANQCATI